MCQWCVILDVFPEDVCDFPLDHESEFDGGEEFMFISAQQVRESVKDGAQMFVMLGSLEAKGNGVV